VGYISYTRQKASVETKVVADQKRWHDVNEWVPVRTLGLSDFGP